MDIEKNTPEQDEHLFGDHELFNFEEATVGQRFLNFLIDWLFMNFALSFLTRLVLVKILESVAPDLAYDLYGEGQDTTSLFFASYLLGIFNFLIYYTFCEKVFKGQTIGKLVTGTRAMRRDGQELSFRNAILRSLSRLVPFEAFSTFGGNPWHDTWTDTMVVKSR